MTNPTHDVAELAADPSAYRSALRAHLQADSATYDRWRVPVPDTVEERCSLTAQLLATLYQAGGWSRYGWPAPAGLGGDPRHRAVFYDELSRAGLPIPDPCLLIETLGSPVAHFAPELATELLPLILSGQEWWGQGFSEPEAGSDLASLRCRAVVDGDELVISGTKLWTSFGDTATRMVALVRTGTAESRHRGLTMVMFDLDSPGVTRRPVALASGQNEVAEFFFDEVRVPRSRVIGEIGKGWAVAMYLLQFERAMYAWQCGGVTLRRLGELRDLVSASGTPVPDGIASRFGTTYADIVTLRARSAGTVRRLAAGETVGPEASVDKILLAQVEIGLLDLARDVLGSDFLLDEPGRDRRPWRDEWWYSRSATIFGGSSEVQRTILADHVLGLPKETA